MTPAAGDPNQQKIMLLMPVIFTFMFWGFPTGLVIYWLANNVLSIGQQMIHNAQAEKAKKAA
jgi:YidC/Oxa1 family membrane protein insertase